MGGLVLGILLGLSYLSIKLYQVITNKYIAKNKAIIFWGIIGTALLAAQMIPPSGWDLYQHYDEINRMRELGAFYVWTKSRYSHLYGTTALFYMTSLTPWNGTLPFVAILLELFIFEKVIAFYKEKIGAQSAGIAFFLFLVLSNIVHAVSGIRNVLAITLINYGIWNFECVTKKKWVTDVAIILLAIVIHPASGFLIIIYLLSYFPSRIVSASVALFILPILQKISRYFLSDKNTVLSSAAALFAYYIEQGAGLDIRVMITSAILIIFSIIVALQILRYSKNKDRYLYFIILYSIGTLGMITQGMIYSRMLYGLNILYPILLVKYCGRSRDAMIAKSVYFYKLYCLIYCVGMLSFQGYEMARAIFIK